MKPLNRKKRRKAQRKFLLVFSVALTVIFGCGLATLYTGTKGIALLERRYEEYQQVFERQAEITFRITEVTDLVYKLKNKKRTLGEHKQLQIKISGLRTETEKQIGQLTEVKDSQFLLYSEMLTQIKEIQSVVDDFEYESEEYLYNKKLLEKCRQKYRKEKGE